MVNATFASSFIPTGLTTTLTTAYLIFLLFAKKKTQSYHPFGLSLSLSITALTVQSYTLSRTRSYLRPTKTMRFASIISLPVVVLALVIGAAAIPSGIDAQPKSPLVKGPSYPTLLLFVLTRSKEEEIIAKVTLVTINVASSSSRRNPCLGVNRVPQSVTDPHDLPVDTQSRYFHIARYCSSFIQS